MLKPKLANFIDKLNKEKFRPDISSGGEKRYVIIGLLKHCLPSGLCSSISHKTEAEEDKDNRFLLDLNDDAEKIGLNVLVIGNCLALVEFKDASTRTNKAIV